MKKTLQGAALLLLLLATVDLLSSTAQAQGTAFTYQGRLNTSGAPANGSYDVQFTLYTANAAGSVFAGPVTNPAVAVTNGLFTTTVDFGAGVFLGSSNWLQIAVSTNLMNNFFTLSPRQQLTPVPYAVTAANLSGSIAPSSISGTIPLAQLPAVLLTNNATAVTLVGTFVGNFGGSFNGNGAGLTGLNASALASGTVPLALLPVTNFWQVGGNTGTSSTNGNYLGTTDNQPLELRVNGQRAIRLEPNSVVPSSPNVIGGSSVNFVADGVFGSTIGGGGQNTATNSVTGNFGTVSGGAVNTAGFEGVVGGGAFNTAASFATVSGGRQNAALGTGSSIGGGGFDGSPGGNTNYGNGAVIGGGKLNVVQFGSGLSVIGGGTLNAVQAGAGSSVIGGGYGNIIQSSNVISTVSGGQGNNIHTGATASTIAGGYYNTIGGTTNPTYVVFGATISGGSGNQIGDYALYSTIGGGLNNSVNASFGTVPGGSNNVVSGQFSFAAGQQAQALHQGTFVWADSQNSVFASTASNQFLIRAQGNVGINITNPSSTLHVNGQLAATSLRAPGAGINTGTFAFTHLAVGTNTATYITTIYNSLTDNDPNAILIITHNWSADTNSVSKYNTTPVGVFYSGSHWNIFYENQTGSMLGRAFNVLVIKP